MKYLDKMARKKLGEILIEEGLVTSDQVVEALKEQKNSGHAVGELLVSYGAVSEWDISQVLCNQFQLPFLYASKYAVSPDVKDIVPPDTLHGYQVVPIDKFGGILVLVAAGLLSRQMVDDLEKLSGCQLFLYVGLATDVRHALDAEFPLVQAVLTDTDTDTEADDEVTITETTPDQWQQLFDMANESVLSEIKPEPGDDDPD